MLTALPVAAESPVNLINAEAAKAEISTAPVRGGISVLMGSGGNIAVLETPQGKLMVDGGISLSKPRLEVALDRLGGGKPRFLVNTHWHWDHADGNAWLHAKGATILAHPNTSRHLSHEVRVEDWQYTFAPVAEDALPTELVDQERILSLGGERAVIRYYGPSHTDGDLYVYFVGADVLVTGDTYWNGVYPFIDHVAGGSIDGMIRAAEISLERCGPDTLVIPGHGAVATRRDLAEFRDMLVAVRGKVAKLKRDGKTLEQAIAARPTAEYDAKWGQFVIDPAFFVRLVWRGV